MRKSRVWNRSTSDYSEMFQNKQITIPAGQFVLMNVYEAAAFKGQYPGKNVHKIIDVEDLPGNEKDDLQVCNMCSFTCATEKELLAHLRTHKPMEDTAPEPDSSGEISALRNEIAELRGLLKQKPGRRKRIKEATHDSGANSDEHKGAI
jgi:hypothetical protein